MMLLIVAGLAGLAAPLLVTAYHRFVVWTFKKTGTHLPDNPAIDADIVAVVKGLLPVLVEEAVSRKIDPQELVNAVNAALAKVKAGR